MDKELVAQQLQELADQIRGGLLAPASFAIEVGQEGLGSSVKITRVRMVLVEQAHGVPQRTTLLGNEEKLS